MKKLLGLIIILAILGGLGYIFYSNNYAMTLIFKADNDKAITIINNAIENNSNWDYYNFITTTKKINTTTEDSATTEASLKIVKLEDDSYEFTGNVKKIEGTTTEEYTVYYKEGKLYTLSETSKTWQTMTIEEAMTSIFDTFSSSVFPATYSEIESSDFEDLKTTFAFDLSPFYFGQKFTITTSSLVPTIVLDVDFLGNLRNKTFSATYGALEMSISSTYLTVNKPLTLVFPTDLADYIETV
ncbi:MAG: fibroblast growth factor [Clostridia bacterium]|jgi:hypothetical protein|nr:fibroblast growth factor [Clostridia bacterium]